MRNSRFLRSRPQGRPERINEFTRQVAESKRNGSYRLKWAVLDGRRLQLSVASIAKVLDIPVDDVKFELDMLRQQAR